MCVDIVTTGSPNAANTFSRPGSTAMRSAAPPKCAASTESSANKKSPTAFSFFVVDSMSTSARVNAKTSIPPAISGWKRNETRGCRLSIALHPVHFARQAGAFTDDSGQALDPSPNRRGFSYRCDFGGEILAPFARRSDAVRNRSPGYLWPPLLYQEHFESKIPREKKRTDFLRNRVEEFAKTICCGAVARYSSSGFSGTSCEASSNSP